MGHADPLYSRRARASADGSTSIPSRLEPVLRWLCLSSLAALLASACAHDARLEAPRASASSQLITPAGPSRARQPEVLQAEVELFGLPLGSLESSLCPSATGSTIS